ILDDARVLVGGIDAVEQVLLRPEVLTVEATAVETFVGEGVVDLVVLEGDAVHHRPVDSGPGDLGLAAGHAGIGARGQGRVGVGGEDVDGKVDGSRFGHSCAPGLGIKGETAGSGGVGAHVHAVVGHEEVGNADAARALRVPTMGDTVARVDRAHAGTLDGASGSGVEDLAVVHPALVTTDVDGAGGDRHCGEGVAARSADPHRVGIGVVGFGRPAGGRIT